MKMFKGSRKKRIYLIIVILIIFFVSTNGFLIITDFIENKNNIIFWDVFKFFTAWILVFLTVTYFFWWKKIHQKIAISFLGVWISKTKIGMWWPKSWLSKNKRNLRKESWKNKNNWE